MARFRLEPEEGQDPRFSVVIVLNKDTFNDLVRGRRAITVESLELTVPEGAITEVNGVRADGREGSPPCAMEPNYAHLMCLERGQRYRIPFGGGHAKCCAEAPAVWEVVLNKDYAGMGTSINASRCLRCGDEAPHDALAVSRVELVGSDEGCTPDRCHLSKFGMR